jgi:hypothetical protein
LKDKIKQDGKSSITTYNKEPEATEAELTNGNFITHTAMKKKIKE